MNGGSLLRPFQFIAFCVQASYANLSCSDEYKRCEWMSVLLLMEEGMSHSIEYSVCCQF